GGCLNVDTTSPDYHEPRKRRTYCRLSEDRSERAQQRSATRAEAECGPIGLSDSPSHALPKTRSPHVPIAQVLTALLATLLLDISSLHIIQDRIGYAQIVQLRQLCRWEAGYGFRVAHFRDDGLGRHTFLTHLDNLTYCDRLGLLEQRRTATQRP